MLDEKVKVIDWSRVRLCLVVADGFATGMLTGVWFYKFSLWSNILEVVAFGLLAAFFATSLFLFCFSGLEPNN